MRLAAGFVFGWVLSGLAPSAASAERYTPWDPVLDLGGAELLNAQQLADRGRYPLNALRNREEGQVVFSFEITSGGRARNCRVVRSSGYRRLDNMPCPIFEGWARFRPAVGADGRPVATMGTASAEFALGPRAASLAS